MLVRSVWFNVASLAGFLIVGVLLVFWDLAGFVLRVLLDERYGTCWFYVEGILLVQLIPVLAVLVLSSNLPLLGANPALGGSEFESSISF